MLKYIIKRILLAIPVLLGVSILVFLIMRVFSADPAPVVLGQHATAEAMEAWRDANGLNDPIIVQYFDFLTGALTGDLGESYYTHTPVIQELMSRFPATVELALVAIVIATVVGRRLDDLRPDRCLHADLLVGNLAHHPLRRRASRAPVVRSHRSSACTGGGYGPLPDRYPALR